jgi:hypothetical protein
VIENFAQETGITSEDKQIRNNARDKFHFRIRKLLFIHGCCHKGPESNNQQYDTDSN